MMLLSAFLLQGVAASALKTFSEAVPLANGVVHPEVQTALDAHDAQKAAESTRVAADLASTVAQRAVVVAQQTQDALNQAQDVVHQARVTSQVLTPDQHQTLFKAEASLKTASSKGQQSTPDGELSQMQGELRQLRDQLEACDKTADKSVEQMDSELRELQDMLSRLEATEKNTPSRSGHHRELEIEIQHLRESVERLEKFGKHSVKIPKKIETVPQHGELRYRMKVHKHQPRVHLTPLDDVAASAAPMAPVQPAVGRLSGSSLGQQLSGSSRSAVSPAPCPPGSAIDIDTEMPYGELEPFGREDTAQELTEASISESDAMVDQVERAEVAEEKRAVFRALTRLRGAAITSFDGVARSQTGNVDEYNKVHKWRMTHPLRHLADEEPDISKWAFPDNADF
jgi:hypothetical protein